MANNDYFHDVAVALESNLPEIKNDFCLLILNEKVEKTSIVL